MEVGYSLYSWIYKSHWQRRDGRWMQTNPAGGAPIPWQPDGGGVEVADEKTPVIGIGRKKPENPTSPALNRLGRKTDPFGHTVDSGRLFSAKKSLLTAYYQGMDAGKVLQGSLGSGLTHARIVSLRKVALGTARVQAWHLADALDGMIQAGIPRSVELSDTLTATYRGLRKMQDLAVPKYSEIRTTLNTLNWIQRQILEEGRKSGMIAQKDADELLEKIGDIACG